MAPQSSERIRNGTSEARHERAFLFVLWLTIGTTKSNIKQSKPLPDVKMNRQIVFDALEYLEKQFKHRAEGRENLTSAWDARAYFRLKLADERAEQFWVAYLDAQNRIIEVCQHSTGTISEARVYPREIARKALLCDAVSVILAHNHPSGHVSPSAADKKLTENIKDGLGLFGITTLDHVIVAGAATYSFAEYGEI